MRVLRVYHAGRDAGHRARERALAAAGLDLTLVVPRVWPERGMEQTLSAEPFPVVELDNIRAGDVNRHRWATDLRQVLDDVRPDVLDVHEEPFSLAMRQWLAVAGQVPVVGYTAQNVDKRFPPPYAQYETRAHARLDGIYACSRQAASVTRGKGFGGVLEVLPLGREAGRLTVGTQTLRPVLTLGLVGRLVPEKGVLDAVRVLAAIAPQRPVRLVVVGDGPEAGPAQELAASLGVADRLELHPWVDATAMAALYRSMDVVLLPSTATQTWTEQFGRVIVEAQAAGAAVAGYASGSIPEVLGTAGIVVPEGDHAALAAAVQAVTADEATFQRYRRAGLQHVEALTWDHVAAHQLALYDRVLHRPAHTPLPRSEAARRQLAVREFGSTAPLAGGVTRPFALPVLRKDTSWTRTLGRCCDLLTLS